MRNMPAAININFLKSAGGNSAAYAIMGSYVNESGERVTWKRAIGSKRWFFCIIKDKGLYSMNKDETLVCAIFIPPKYQ